MPNFIYEAIDIKGQRISGQEEGSSQEEIISDLIKKGLRPITVKKAQAFDTVFTQFFKKELSRDDLLYFTGELGELLSSGVPLERSLVILEDSAEKKQISELVKKIRLDIQGGKSLSSALAQHPNIFDRLYVNMITVGEMGGVLPLVLKRLETFIQKANQVKKFIITSSIYPAILIFVGLLSILIMVTFVVPKFGQIFADMNQPMPFMTQMVVNFSQFIKKWWWFIFISITGSILYIQHFIKSKEGRIWWDSFKLKAPFLGVMILRIEIGRFSRTLGTLIESGVPILRGISLSSEVISNVILKEKFDEIYKGIKQGKSLSQLMKKTGMFPSIVVHLVTIGEETGAIGEMFIKIADDLEDRAQNDTKMYLAMVEPLTILIMGAVLSVIIMSMLLAIFGINDVSF